jgi:two-component system, OmpR family, sensor histidine kinase BaeS
VSRAEEGRLDLRMQPLDLRDLAQASVDAALPTADAAQVQLDCQTGAEPVRVEGDPDRLGQALANLLANAIQHTPAGGRVTVAVGTDHDHAVLDVTDTGAGIDPEHLPHLFQRFYRADPARSRSAGSGIGLTISRAIVAHHGGRLTANSPGPGEGATFTIQLPRSRLPVK